MPRTLAPDRARTATAPGSPVPSEPFDDPAPAHNLAALVLAAAARAPERPALIFPDPRGADRSLGYGELAHLVRGYAAGLRAAGHRPGERLLVLASPSPDFYALALAALATGMTLVLCDGRMGWRRVRAALDDARPDVVVGGRGVMRWWPAVRALRSARRFTTEGGVPGTRRLATLARTSAHLDVTPVACDTVAIVSFTSGSSGRAKAIVRTHGVLLAQHSALRAVLPTAADDVHLTSLPLAALHSLCCGSTAVLAPAGADAAARAAAMLARHAVTSLSGAPALVDAMASTLLARGGSSSLRRVAVGGGPVSRRLCEDVRRAFPRAAAHVVYGSTEAEPIASVPVEDVIAARGEGHLVGLPAPGVELRLADGDGCGEVLVRGAHVVPAARDGGRAGWHRTGDVARRDELGRLWLLGSTGSVVRHRGRVLHPYVVEAEVLAVRGVRAAGLVAHARASEGELAIAIMAEADASATLGAVRRVLAAMELASLPVRVLARLPMDARHASKVQRAELARLLERGR